MSKFTYTLRDWLNKFPKEKHDAIMGKLPEYLGKSERTIQRMLNLPIDEALSPAQMLGLYTLTGVCFPPCLEEINPASYYSEPE